jgi:hypothetical protein
MTNTLSVKKVSYDFEMTSFVGIEAPEGTDPDTLHEQALAEFARRCLNNEAQIMHFQTYDPDTGEYQLMDVPSPMNALAKEQGIRFALRAYRQKPNDSAKEQGIKKGNK